MVTKKNELKVIWYLEMLNPNELSSVSLPDGAQTFNLQIPLPELNRFLYKEIGKLWQWRDRINWTIKDWNKWVIRKELKTEILIYKGTPAGYFELNKQGKEVEIAYFGLLKQFIGKGLGGAFLSVAVKKAWELNAERVWVHTCNLDHPHALINYKARGFKIYDKTLNNN